MTGITEPAQKNLMLFSGRAHPELADEIAAELGMSGARRATHDFANGEIFVRFEESVRGCDAFVDPEPLHADQHLAHGAADHGRRAQARLGQADHRRRAVLPYARQDKKHRGREPISARLIADLFKTAGADRLMTVDLHTAQIQGFFDGPVDHLFALPLLAEYIADQLDPASFTVVSPDAGRVRVAERWTDRLGGAPLAFIHKSRDPTSPNEVVANGSSVTSTAAPASSSTT